MRDTASLIYTPVPVEYARLVWSDVCRVLTKSVETSRGKFSMDDILAGIEDGMYVLWIVLDGDDIIAANTTRLIPYPGNQIGLAIDWLGGSRMSEWLPIMQRVMTEYARSNDCTHLEAYGRKAWGRWLGKYGWNPEYIAYRMELSNG